MLEIRMNRFRAATFVLASLTAGRSFAQTPPAPTPLPLQGAKPGDPKDATPRDNRNLADERVARILPTPGGWTAEQAGSRARATSYDIQAKNAALQAAAAKLDQAVVGFFPRLAGTAKYTHLSALPTTSSASSILLVTPAGTVAPGLLPNGSPLLAVPLSFPVPQENYLFQATITVRSPTTCSSSRRRTKLRLEMRRRRAWTKSPPKPKRRRTRRSLSTRG